MPSQNLLRGNRNVPNPRRRNTKRYAAPAEGVLGRSGWLRWDSPF